MKNKRFVCAWMLLALLWFNPAQAVTDDRDATVLVRAMLPNENDFLLLETDKIRKAEMQKAIDAAETTRSYESFWEADKNSFVIKYANTVSGTAITSMLILAKDGGTTKKILAENIDDAKRDAAEIRARLVELDGNGTTYQGYEYLMLVDEKEDVIGNMITVWEDKHIMVLTIVGSAFTDPIAVDEFLSGKITKALSFQPDKSFPNYLGK